MLEVNLVAESNQGMSQAAAAVAATINMTEINLNNNDNQEINSMPAAGSPSELTITNSRFNSASSADTMPPASELPSYNEALKLKKQEIKLENGEIPPSYYSSTNPNHLDETRIAIDPADLRAIVEASEPLNDQEIGSECMFLSAFMIAFFFNWVGFFASICLLPNAAGKYGALSGFGLSMAKWVTIYQSWMTQMNDFQQRLFFWLFIFIGFYLFFRGLINFMSLKYRPRAHAAYVRRNRERWFGFIE